MENSNLMLLCNTSGINGEIIVKQEPHMTDTSQVKVKVEVDDRTTASTPSHPNPETAWVMNKASVENENCNNNRLSFEENTIAVVDNVNMATVPQSKSNEVSKPNDESVMSPGEGNDSNGCFETRIQQDDRSSDQSGSYTDADGSGSLGCSPREDSSVANSNSAAIPTFTDTFVSSAQNAIDPLAQTHYTHANDPGYLFGQTDGAGHRAINENLAQNRNGSNVAYVRVQHQVPTPVVPGNRETARKDLSSQFDIPQQSQGTHFQQEVPMYVHSDENYAYDNVPGMETLADTALVHMSRIQQAAFEQAQMEISQQAPIHGSYSSYGFPIASSTPEASGRSLSFMTPDGQIHDPNLIQAFQSMQADPQSLNQHHRQGHAHQEQMHWIPNNMNGLPHNQQGAMVYEQTPVGQERNWNMHPNVPLDMSQVPLIPTSCEDNRIPPRLSESSEMTRERPTAVKRSQSMPNASNDAYNKPAKVAKTGAGNGSSKGENYQISTNVHTLKPRHMISWYIDHLIQENENITQISKSYTIPVNILNSKDMYFMDSVFKRVNFPTPKFLEWMQGNFPNINIHAIDFSEGRPPYLYIPYEDQLRGKDRNDIIRDIFFFFQRCCQEKRMT